MAKRATLADVAQLAGLSITTVSMVLNDRPNTRLSAEAAERVRAAAAKLNYRPNPAARGLRLGKTKAPGSLEFDYNYRELEANAVLGAWTDSDFIGGGTDGKGHKFALGVQLTKVLKGTVTYFMNEKGLTGDSKDYDRLQVDVAAKF